MKKSKQILDLKHFEIETDKLFMIRGGGIGDTLASMAAAAVKGGASTEEDPDDSNGPEPASAQE